MRHGTIHRAWQNVWTTETKCNKNPWTPRIVVSVNSFDLPHNERKNISRNIFKPYFQTKDFIVVQDNRVPTIGTKVKQQDLSALRFIRWLSHFKSHLFRLNHPQCQVTNKMNRVGQSGLKSVNWCMWILYKFLMRNHVNPIATPNSPPAKSNTHWLSAIAGILGLHRYYRIYFPNLSLLVFSWKTS